MMDSKFSCLTIESIRLMTEAANLPDPTDEVATLISEDVAFKLKLIISRAMAFMKHSNRETLSCSDINRALKWSDCQPLFGYECAPNRNIELIHSQGASVYTFCEDTIDLSKHREIEKKFRSILTDEKLEEAQPNLTIKDLGPVLPCTYGTGDN